MIEDINNLTVTVKRAGSFISIPALARVSGIEFSSGYPGGLFLDCAFFLPGDVRVPCQIQANDYVTVWCGLEIAWQGDVVGLEASAEIGEVGWHVTALGWWATHLMARSVAKPWLDKRYDESVWSTWPTGANGRLEKFDLDREERIRVTPKDGIAFASGDTAWFAAYEPPVGQTIKRITFDYDYQEGAQTSGWTLGLYNVTTAAIVWSVATSGTGSVDHTFATPSARAVFWLQSIASQTGIGDGTVYGQVSNLAVYTETGAINPQEIVKDCAYLGSLSADLTAIAAATGAIEYVALPAKYLSDIVTEMAEYGIGANGALAAYVDNSTGSSDGLPRLALQPLPALATTRDYIVRVDAPNVGAAVKFSQDMTSVYNIYNLSFTDARGIEKYVSWNNDAGLLNQPSIDAYGQRSAPNIEISTTDLALVKQYGKVKLSQTKDLKWKASGDIVINGWIEGGTGGRIPAAMVIAGKVLQITNYLYDLNSTGLRLLITGTRYNHDLRQVSISTGWPDTTESWLARELRQRTK